MTAMNKVCRYPKAHRICGRHGLTVWMPAHAQVSPARSAIFATKPHYSDVAKCFGHGNGAAMFISSAGAGILWTAASPEIAFVFAATFIVVGMLFLQRIR